MPKYTYRCKKCDREVTKFASVDKREDTCECGSSMSRLAPKLRGSKTTEVVNKYTNKKHIEDQENVLEERKLDYYWSVEVPRLVNSGIYELETMLEQGWVYYNENGNLVTRTKPPQKE